MNDWPKVRLEEICDVRDGTHASPKAARSGRLLVTSKNLLGGRLSLDNAYHVSFSDAAEIDKRSKVDQWDILISMIGTVGEVAIIKDRPTFVIKNVGLFKTHGNQGLANWIYYFLKSKYGKEEVQARLKGTSQQYISLGELRNFPIPIPPLATQRAITERLSAYDNLIENNTCRIAILETKAEQLYKEWFVRRQSPEHSATTGVTLSLGDAIKISRGLSYTSSEIDTDAGVQLINLKNIQPYGGFRYDGTKRFSGKYKPDQIVVRGDLVMGVTDMTQDRRAVGSVALMPPLKETSVISADLIKIESKIDKFFLYAMFRYGGLSRYISQFANGANVLHLRPQAIMGIKVQVPSKESIERFSERLRPMIALADNLNEQNALLAKERDLLLPRLMSGRMKP